MLNQLSQISARFHVRKFAFMADITKCFFQVNLPENQRNLFCLLWFENYDIQQGKIIPFCFRCYPWGIKSSSFVANWAIRKTIKHDVTKASDITLDSLLFVITFIWTI